jgi:hypothetical protein
MLAQTVTPPSNIARALAQMETYFSTPKDPEGFESFFRDECQKLKLKVRDAITAKLAELPGPVMLSFKSNCCLSGGSISSIYHGEAVKDYDLWVKDKRDIETIRRQLEQKDFSNIVTEDNGSEYDGMKMPKGRYTSDNAITLQNRIQFILLSDLEDARGNFDFIHCLPYYDLLSDKMYISKAQFAAIRHKQLIANNSDNVTKKRIEKFRAKGWSLR